MLDARDSGLENMSYGIGFELRLPLEWNGRLLFQGGGGLNGVLGAAIGRVSGSASALERGFAVVSTDGGHQAMNNIDSRFGADQQAKLDFGWMALQRTTTEAKTLISQVYGRAPEYSYFMGCSTGGREAMMAAQRLPLEFDGVVAGTPSFNLTRVAMNQVWSLQTVNRSAPRDDNGLPQLDKAYTDIQLQTVAQAVLERCDALDGLTDGMINDFQACDFEPPQLQCGTSTAPGAGQCLSAEQVTGLRDIFGGARNSRGESLYGSTPYDTGIGLSAWRGMHLGNPGGAPANASLGRDTLRQFSMTPPVPDLDPLQFDFDSGVALTTETAAINDAVATLHTSFAGHGGKMIVYHGLSDQAMWAGALIDWYEQLTPADDQGPQDGSRMFLVPGMTHCAGGQSTDQFDMLTAIQSWVEQGNAPDQIIATGNAFPDVERPLCPYPKVARFQGGDESAVESFACK
jgi:feruloyl esterase